MKQRIILIALSFSMLLLCCQSNNKLDKELLLNHYSSPQDSLKREAVLFLLDNIKGHTSEIPIFTNTITKEEVYLDLDTIFNEEDLLEIIRERGLSLSTKTFSDTELIDNDFLIRHIDQAFAVWNKYPWAKGVPKNIFFNYLLPYKIYGEKVSNWRQDLHRQYADLAIEKQLHDKDVHNANWLYYKIVSDEIGQTYLYDRAPLQLTKYVGYSELNTIKKVECNSGSYLGVYTLRALGIPAAVAFVPLWGSRNGGHATEVFWESDSLRFITAKDRELTDRHPSKVFRYSYQKQGIWTDTIKPLIGSLPFLLEYLTHDNWADVTHEHTQTSDIEYKIDESIASKFAYICVFNYGKWEPVFWGKIDKNKTAHFRDMGIDVLYRIAIPQKNSFKMISDIFRIDSSGNQIFYEADTLNKASIQVQRVNEGSRSWLEKGKVYSLFFINDNIEWELVEQLPCVKDSILIFDNVPSNALYRIIDESGNSRLERIFTYQDTICTFY